MRRTRLVGTVLVLVSVLALSGCGFFNQPPNAAFVVRYNVDSEDPLWVTLDATGSQDPDGDRIVAYMWTFDDDVTIQPKTYGRTVTDQVITVRYPFAGTHAASLAVRDEHGGVSGTSLTVSQEIILPHLPVAPPD